MLTVSMWHYTSHEAVDPTNRSVKLPAFSAFQSPESQFLRRGS